MGGEGGWTLTFRVYIMLSKISKFLTKIKRLAKKQESMAYVQKENNP